MSHSHEGGPSHSHDHPAGDHGHTHEILDGPGSYMGREMPIIEGRNWSERAFTVGIGGPVGSGKTALMLALCNALREKYSIAAVTNDIFTREDAEFLTKHKALPASRIRAIETGGCPHAAVREDISATLLLLKICTVNSLPTYYLSNREAITWPLTTPESWRITSSTSLIGEQDRLGRSRGADLDVMDRDARKMREGGPTVFAQVKGGVGMEHIIGLIESAWKGSGAERVSKERGGPKATEGLEQLK
ncbi:urease accessory protein ureG-like protein [Botrytis cinerea]